MDMKKLVGKCLENGIKFTMICVLFVAAEVIKSSSKWRA